ncbi:MAG: CapA family protein [Anaerolineae bacterium]|nr:CapA family protein [Anaerolineae bacterium]
MGAHPVRGMGAARALTWLPVLALLALPGSGYARPGVGEPPDAAPLTLVLLGDVMLGRGVAGALDGEWEAAFAGVRPWLGAGRDLVVANLESPLTGLPQVRQGYDLRAPPEAVAALRSAGFSAVSLANNHALDAGADGLRETVWTVRQAGIVPWLEGVPTSTVQAPTSTVQAPTSTVQAPTSTVQAPTSTVQAPTSTVQAPDVLGLALDDSVVPVDVGAAAAVVASAAAQGKAVVVSIHWGGEYQAEPSARQRALARALAEAGATVIAGHGPHVLQRVEWVGETLVAYSLGNALFDQRYPLDCRWGAILRVTLQGAQVVALEAIPTVVEEGRVRRAEGDTAAEIAACLGLDGQG